jgi:hypothetical protein
MHPSIRASSATYPHAGEAVDVVGVLDQRLVLPRPEATAVGDPSPPLLVPSWLGRWDGG